MWMDISVTFRVCARDLLPSTAHSQLISLRTETAVAARQRVALRAAAAGARLAAALMLLTDARRLAGAAATKAACTRCCAGLLVHCTTAMREVAT
jgi:hypothetical protein